MAVILAEIDTSKFKEIVAGENYDVKIGDKAFTLESFMYDIYYPTDEGEVVFKDFALISNIPKGTPIHLNDASLFVDGNFFIGIAYEPVLGEDSSFATINKDSLVGAVLIGDACYYNYFYVYQSKPVQKTKYDIKLLPEELLPKNVATKGDILEVQGTLTSGFNYFSDRLGNYVSHAYSQYLSDDDKEQARENIGASDFSGNYHDLENRPCDYEKKQTQIFVLSGYYGQSVFNGGSTETYTRVSNSVSIPTLTKGNIVQVFNDSRNGWPYPEMVVKELTLDNGTVCCYVGNLSLANKLHTIKTQMTPNYSETYYPTSGDSTGEDFLLITSKNQSSYFMLLPYGKYHYPYTEVAVITEEITQLDSRLISDDIQRVGADVIISSSSEGSAKKFKLTVDDTGIISAVEVTDGITDEGVTEEDKETEPSEETEET